MTWFKVDDSLHSHPKAMAASLAALGLWTAAGSWSSGHLTDGFIPDHMIPSLSRGQVELAKELCVAGLWRRSKGGYQFHQWHEDSDGTTRNPTREAVESTRVKRAEAGRKGGLASGKTRSKPKANGKANASDLLRESLNPRPVPSSPEGTGTDTGSQSVLRRNPRGSGDDDDSIDLATVELLAELTGREVSVLWAARVRAGILDGRTVKNRLAYLTKAIRERPQDFLPPVDSDAGGRSPLRAAPEWCGYCNPMTRLIELADDTVARCQQCHPLAWRSA
ncbi:hypothetical protein [Streptosporangium sp. NPDC004631]